MFRRTPMQNAVSTQARAVQSYYPFYPPPVIDESNVTHGSGFSGWATQPLSYTDERTDKGIVDRKMRRDGERNIYQYGAVLRKTFRMIATGQVESSRYQQYSNMPQLLTSQNDALYRAAKGYPMNLGLSEKVPTLPRAALGDQPQMTPRTQITRNIFTTRNFSNAKSIPAKPQAR